MRASSTRAHVLSPSFVAVCVAACCLAAACGQGEAPSPQGTNTAPPTPTAAPAPAAAVDPVAEATQIFSTRCTPCHGPQGGGDGPASKGLVPPPRNFGDPAWQSGVTDEHIEKIIQYGGAAVGKSPTMPANPDLNSKPDVVKALVAHIRSLKS